MENLKKELIKDENIDITNGYYRFVSHVAKLASIGYTQKKELIANAETMNFNDVSIEDMRNSYYWLFPHGGVPTLRNQTDNKESEKDVVLGIYNDHKNKLNILKDNRSRAEEEKWSDKEIEAVDRQIEILASVLSDLFRKVIDVK